MKGGKMRDVKKKQRDQKELERYLMCLAGLSLLSGNQLESRTLRTALSIKEACQRNAKSMKAGPKMRLKMRWPKNARLQKAMTKQGQ